MVAVQAPLPGHTIILASAEMWGSISAGSSLCSTVMDGSAGPTVPSGSPAGVPADFRAHPPRTTSASGGGWFLRKPPKQTQNPAKTGQNAQHTPCPNLNNRQNK